MLLCVQTTRTANAVVDYRRDYRTMRIRAYCGKYIGLCAGGTFACGPRASHRTSSSRSSPYPQALPTTLPARSSSPVAPTPRPHPQAATTGCLSRRAYQAHPTTRPRTPKRHSQTRRPQAEAANSDRRTLTRLGRCRPVRARGFPRLRASSMRSSTSSLVIRASRSPSSCHRPKPIMPRGAAAGRLRGCVLERASCAYSEEQRAHEYKLVVTEPAPGRPPADDTDKRSWRARRGASQFGEFAG